MKGKIWTFT